MIILEIYVGYTYNCCNRVIMRKFIGQGSRTYLVSMYYIVLSMMSVCLFLSFIMLQALKLGVMPREGS